MNNAARVWWLLRQVGVADVRLFNGGWKTWKAEGRPTTEEVASVSRLDFKATPRAQRLATKGLILDSIKGRTLQVVDAGSEKEFCGLDRQNNHRARAIPGAKNLDGSEWVDPKTLRFQSADELTRRFERAGIDLRRPGVAYCQSGGLASVMAFAMEWIDVHDSYRNWGEWGNLEDTPIVVHQGQETKKGHRRGSGSRPAGVTLSRRVATATPPQRGGGRPARSPAFSADAPTRDRTGNGGT